MKEAKSSSLTAADVRAIRAQYNVVTTSKGTRATNVIELAKKYGISQESVRNIANRKTFTWV